LQWINVSQQPRRDHHGQQGQEERIKGQEAATQAGTGGKVIGRLASALRASHIARKGDVRF